jgi:transposase
MKLLSAAQELQIQKMITDKTSDQMKLNFALWTRKAVKELVKREFGISIAVTTMGEHLADGVLFPKNPRNVHTNNALPK